MTSAASALIAALNHLSGAAEPSEAERLLARDQIAATHPAGVNVLDHIILAAGTVFSFVDQGLLDELKLAAGIV